MPDRRDKASVAPAGSGLFLAIQIAAFLVLTAFFLLNVALKEQEVSKRVLLIGFGLLGSIVLFAAARYPQFMRQQVLTFTTFSFLTGSLVAPGKIRNIAFFEVTAQIAPVLLLALAVEARSFYGEVISRERQVFAIVIVLLLSSGGESLRVLAIGDATKGLPWLVIGSMAAAAFQLGMVAITGPQEASATT